MTKRLFLLLIITLFASMHARAQEDSIIGEASYYANRFHGQKTASGERYDKNAFTCAHLTYAFGTMLRVKHLTTGKEVVVRVTDRGPYSKKFTIDLSYAAAEELGIIRAGHAKVAIFSYVETIVHPDTVILPTFQEFRHDAIVLPQFKRTDTIPTTPPLLPLSAHEKQK